MKDKIKKLYKTNSRLIKYGLIGGLSSSLDFAIYTLLVITNINLLIANIIGVNAGIFTSFILNRQFNFKVKDHTGQRFLSFYTIGLIGLVISSGLLYVFVDCLSLNKIIAKIITIVLVALIQFILNSRVTFKIKQL